MPSVLGAAVVLVLLAELGARAIGSNLPDPLVWHSWETQKKVEQMDALERRGGTDIVFLGTSLVNAGIEPTSVDQQFNGGVSSYNAALSSGIPRIMEPWGIDVVLPKLTPTLLVVGLSSYDFADDPGGDRFYDAFSGSPEARRAMGLDDPLEHVDRFLRDHFTLWRDRFSLRQPEVVLDALSGKAQAEDPFAAAIQPTGRTSYGQTQQFDEAPAGFGPPVAKWTLGTRNREALQRLIGDAKARNVKVVLVDLPVTDEYIARHPHGGDDYQTFLTALRSIGAAASVPVLEYDSMRDHKYFADQVHLNADGARVLSAKLGADLKAIRALPGT